MARQPSLVRLCASVKACGHKSVLPVCPKNRILLFVIRTLIQIPVWCVSRRASLFARFSALSVVIVYHHNPRERYTQLGLAGHCKKETDNQAKSIPLLA
jgi:hypothetical protein